MRIEEYIQSLPQNIVSGEDVDLPENSFREIFDFVNLGKEDVFYHLGCGYGQGVNIAAREYNVRKSTGIDKNQEKINSAKNSFGLDSVEFICKDIRESDFSDATVILFWFIEEKIISEMMKKFEVLKPGVRIITVWGPLPFCLPEKVRFPFIINSVPFKKAKDLSEQLLAMFGVKCVDFITAWEFAERYTKAIQKEEAQNDRFLTIIQSLMIWINAKNLGVACGDEIPESIKTYIGIMKNFYNIDFEHLLK